MSGAIYHATPTKPSRQMSQHASSRSPTIPAPQQQQHTYQHGGSSSGYHDESYDAPQPPPQQHHQQFGNPFDGPGGAGSHQGYRSSHDLNGGDVGYGSGFPRTQSPEGQAGFQHDQYDQAGFQHDQYDQAPLPPHAPFHAYGQSPQGRSSPAPNGGPYGYGSSLAHGGGGNGGGFATSQSHLVGMGDGGDGSNIYNPSPGYLDEEKMSHYSKGSYYADERSAAPSPMAPGSGMGAGYESIEMHQERYAPSPLGYKPNAYPGAPPPPPPMMGGGPNGFSGPGPLHLQGQGDPTPPSFHSLGTPGHTIASGAQGNMQFRGAPPGAGGYGATPSGYGETKARLMRARTVKHIELTNGNLVLDVPVPYSITKQGQGAEFNTMRYQAVTCDPNDFVRERYALRPWVYGRAKGGIEMMIVLTMYNEDATLFTRTINGVIKNIEHLCGRTKSKTWGPDAWKKVVVVVVSDGRKKANADTLKVLGLMGCYNEAVMLDHVGDKPTTAHLFEYSSQVVVQPDGTVRIGSCPIQLLFCLKEKNQKKLNSHRWFFNAFAQQLQPNVCILLDVGTKPGATSLYDLWKAFDKHPSCGGACGEIRVDTGKLGWQLVNPLVASQNFEYKISNILDKPLESVFGYISVLPGAFSAYRYKAIQGRPLTAYFKGEALHSGVLGDKAHSFESNMYLAEDRILCAEIVFKQDAGWTLRYIKSAHASTDVPDGVPEFIAQRRRWLNGSFFASIYATAHFYRIWTSGQNFFRKIALTLQAVYNLAQLIFTWTAIANFFLAFYFLVSSATSDPKQDPFGGQGQPILEVVQNLFIALIVVCLVCSLGNRPQGSKITYTAVIVLFALIMALALYCAGWTTYIALKAAGLTRLSNWTLTNVAQLLTTSAFRDIVISIAATYFLWLIASILFLDPWHMITSIWAYLLLVPFYTIVLAIYSMANLHDVSWGTKGSDTVQTDLGQAKKEVKDGKDVVKVAVPTTAEQAEDLWSSMQRDLATPKPETKSSRSTEQKQQDAMATFRTNFLLSWIVTNAALILVFTSSWFKAYIERQHRLSGADGPVINPYQTAVFWSMAGFAAIRAVGAFVYTIFWLLGL